MSKNNRPRRTSQRPSAAHLSPGSGSPQDGERIPLLDEGFPQLLSVCPSRRAAWRLHTAWIEGDLPVWRDGKLADPDEYSFRVWTDVDGRERLKVRKGTDAVTASGDRLLGIDQSNHKWETTAVGIAALRERLIKEQLPADPLRVELVGTPKVQLVGNPTSQAQAKTPPRELTAKEWITLEAQRLKRSDEIPVGIKKTDFAKMLETNMEEANRSDHSISISPVGWRYISNFLQAWALWPITDIKIPDIE